MQYKNSTLNSLRADILADTKRFLKCLDGDTSMEELKAILEQIKEKEALLLKKEGSMIAPELWSLLHNRLSSKINRDSIDKLPANLSPLDK